MRRVGEDEKPLVCALLATENNSEELKKFILQVKELEKVFESPTKKAEISMDFVN